MFRDRVDRDEFRNASVWSPSTQSSYGSSRDSSAPPRQDTEKSHPSLGIIETRTLARGNRLPRFWSRTISLILAPAIIATYFFWIWQFILKYDSPVKYGGFDERGIFYSWFVLGVFGLNISRFGILGIEASMLQEPFWQTKTAMNLLMHSGSSWGGAGGWARCIAGAIHWKRSVAGRLWYLLSFITLALFIGLPISGLSLELTDGYVYSPEAPKVVGRTWSDYNLRETLQVETRGLEGWSTGTSVSLPGIGLAYTPSYLDRGDLRFLETVPNSFPVDRGVPELFLAPQADVPISGEAWGLRLSYNCSVVESASDLKLLNRKAAEDWVSKPFGPSLKIQPLVSPPRLLLSVADRPNGNNTMYLFNSTSTVEDLDTEEDTTRSRNIWAYGELATSREYLSAWEDDEGGNDSDSDGAFVDGTLEYVLWQVGFSNEHKPALETSIVGKPAPKGSNFAVVDFDNKVEPSIKGLDSPFIQSPNGTFAVNESYFDLKVMNSVYADIFSIEPDVRTVAAPIGVQCRHRSVLGTAQLDARTTSFSGFTATPPPLFNDSTMNFRTAPFGRPTEQILAGHYFHTFPSINSPPPVSSASKLYYKSFVKPEMLLQSVRRAYAVDAMQLMYDGLPGLSGAYLNENLASSRKGKVIEPGIMPPIIPAVWLTVWAFVCALLGFRYGFLRRWSASLDGFSMLRFGAQFADEIRDVSSTGLFEECERLWDFPGFVGDARREDDVGHVSLVSKDEVADKGKLYV